MRIWFWSLAFVFGMILSAYRVAADEEPQKTDANQPKAEAAKLSAMKKLASKRRTQSRMRAIEKHVVAEDWDAVLAGLDEIIADKEIDRDDLIEALRNKFIVLAEERLDGEKACPIAKRLGELGKDNAEVLNEVAWTLLDTEGLKNRDLDLALALAKRACKLTGDQYGEYLDTLARAHYEKGDIDLAVKVQTQAVEKLKDDPENTDDVREEVRAVLEKYKAKQAEKKLAKPEKKSK